MEHSEPKEMEEQSDELEAKLLVLEKFKFISYFFSVN